MNTIHKRAKRGFTLLEILLVIAAIGILAAIVLVAINPNRQINQARQAAINSEKNTIEKALQQRLIDTGQYPSSIEGVQKEVCVTGAEQEGGSTSCTGKADLRALVPNYIASIPNSTTYTVNTSNDGRVYVNTSNTAANLSCPTGYIRVPGNSLYQTKDFCVMKYEAKAVATSAPTVGLLTPTTGSNTIANNTTATTSANGRGIASVASGYPIANISQTTAIDYCQNQNTVSGGTLITNAEWMTIARNIEGVLSNWTTGSAASTAIGTGGLYRGHSDNGPATALEASTNDTQGYTGTGNSGFSIERRTLTLSNGETIWDMGGNVWEWTSDTILGKDQPTGSSTGFTWRQHTAITNYGTLSYDLVRPSNPAWNSSQNMGQIYSDGTSTNNTNFAFGRGGSWLNAANAGVFTLSLDSTPTNSSLDVGFRCVLR